MKKIEQIVLAGGCFWCTEAVFQRLKGIQSIVSGYTGGHIKNPAYREVCSGRTGHAEGILVSYESETITLKTLLEVFFTTHDPTTLNRQGNDVGTQYRSAIFYTSAAQKMDCSAFIENLQSEKVFEDPIVTQLAPLEVFYPAEDYHQNYYNDHRDQPYCSVIISPKLQKLRDNYANQLKTE